MVLLMSELLKIWKLLSKQITSLKETQCREPFVFYESWSVTGGQLTVAGLAATVSCRPKINELTSWDEQSNIVISFEFYSKFPLRTHQSGSIQWSLRYSSFDILRSSSLEVVFISRICKFDLS
jgi:hypothetical protein